MDWKSLSDVIEVADYSGLGRFVLHTDNYPQEISSLECAPGALEAIGVRAVLGRAFSDDEFRSGSERVIMIGHILWREHFGASPSVLGKTIRVSAATSGETPTTYRIIGVLPPNLRYVGNYGRDPADTAMPLTSPRTAYMVRLREGVPTAIAARRITEAVRSVASEIPAGWQGVRLESVHEHYVRDVRPVLVGVTVAAALVLLIVVMNIAVLMLLRALRRQKETAVRVALGAEPHRIARLLFAEAALVCGSALVAGVAVTTMTLRALGPQIEARLGRARAGRRIRPRDGRHRPALDWRHRLAERGDRRMAADDRRAPHPTRRQPARRGRRRHRLSDRAPRSHGPDRAGVAASTALLIGGGLMLRSVANLIGTNLGYETHTCSVRASSCPPRLTGTTDVLRPILRSPGGTTRCHPQSSFALSTFVPFWEPRNGPLETDRGANSAIRASITAAGPDYFRTLGIGLREGRAFTRVDRTGAEPVAVISESLARAVAPRGSALGNMIDDTEWTVTGETVASGARWWSRPRHPPDACRRRPERRVHPVSADAPLASRALYPRDGSSQQWLEPRVRSWPPSTRVSLSVRRRRSPDRPTICLAGPRFVTALLAAFAIFAALDRRSLGIYAVTAYAVQQREREIAIRMAIGATAGTVIRMFVRDSGTVLLIGLAGGVFGGAAVSRILQSQLHGVERFDAWTLAVTCVFLVTAGLLATWLPTWPRG